MEVQPQAQLDELLKQQRLTIQANNQLQLETETLGKKLEDLKLAQTDAEGQIEELKTEVDALTVARAGKLGELSDLEEKIRVATAELETAKRAGDEAGLANAASLKQVQSDQDAIVADAQGAVDDLTAKKAALEKEITPLADQAARLQVSIAEAMDSVSAINKKIDDATATLSTLTAKQSVVNESIQTLTDQETTLQADIDSKKAVSAALDTQIQGKRDDLTKAQSDLDAVKNELETNNEQNADFLKLRAGVMDKGTQVDERLAWLQQKYGELGEPW